jgi:hypothetical protein
MISVEQRRANNRASYGRHRTTRIAATAAYAKAHRTERKEWLRRWLIEKRFNKTMAWFATQVPKGCAICHTHVPGGRYNQWHIDHNHSCCPGMGSCGKCVRGILCAACNLLLGAVHDSASTLHAAATYLEAHNG